MRNPEILLGYLDETVSIKHIFATPDIYSEKSKLCLPLAIIIGFHHQAQIHMETKNQLPHPRHAEMITAAKFYRHIKILQKNPTNKRALSLLEKKWETIRADLNVGFLGPFELNEFGSKLADYFGINLYLLEKGGKSVYFQYPKTYDCRKPTIFLLLRKNHVDYILNRELLLKKVGVQCLFCSKVLKRFQNGHRCYDKNFCFCCNRYKKNILSLNDYPFLTKQNERKFCLIFSQTEFLGKCYKTIANNLKY